MHEKENTSELKNQCTGIEFHCRNLSQMTYKHAYIKKSGPISNK